MKGTAPTPHYDIFPNFYESTRDTVERSRLRNYDHDGITKRERGQTNGKAFISVKQGLLIPVCGLRIADLRLAEGVYNEVQ
jgi:hypothetical protein